MNELREISSDLFGIADRVRGIDDGYRIMFNNVKRRFEVHNLKQKGSTLALVLPFDELDSRTVELVRQTSSSRADVLLAMVEQSQRLMDKENYFD